MPVGAIIGGVASIAGGILSSKSQKKAANTAAQVATDNTAANNALAKDIYGQNKQTLAPFVNTGTNASGAINALLGLGGPQPIVGGQQWGGGPATAQINTFGSDMGPAGYVARGEGFHNGEPLGGMEYGASNGFTTGDQMATNVTTTAAPQTGQQQYQNAFANYRNSTGYQFRQSEGMRGLDASYASRGVGQSGAAAKSALKYNQNIASGEFGNYLNALMSQQGVGLSAAGAQAGVSTNFVNQATANNNSGASALANAAIAKGNATGQMWQGIAGGVGNIFGSSFG